MCKQLHWCGRLVTHELFMVSLSASTYHSRKYTSTSINPKGDCKHLNALSTAQTKIYAYVMQKFEGDRLLPTL